MLSLYFKIFIQPKHVISKYDILSPYKYIGFFIAMLEGIFILDRINVCVITYADFLLIHSS